MFELDQKYKCGWKTFIFLFISYGWWLSLVGIGFIYLAWLEYFGPFRNSVEGFLAGHPDWYIDITMLSEWTLMLGLGFIFIGYLRAMTIHRSYKFTLDEHAFHLRRGLFFIQETSIPYQQISKVNISRPYHYRMFGVSELDIITADDRNDSYMKTKSSSFLIPVIDTSVAKALSKQLMGYASMIKHGQKIEEPEYEDEEDYDGEGEEECETEEESN
jgi:uncharacterized membrane protein YdbT with pleckstrin-like domain